ncbi:MAG: hypothetical protein U0271_35575 [Polyangiaceae bacterium]
MSRPGFYRLVVGAALLVSCTFPDVDFKQGGGGRGGAASGGAGGQVGPSSGGGGEAATTGGFGGALTTGGAGGSGGSGGGPLVGGEGGGVLFCKDGDGDHYLSLDSDPGCLSNTSFDGDGDCDDDNDNVHPGQATFFTTGDANFSPGSVAYWDYDCDGLVLPEYEPACNTLTQTVGLQGVGTGIEGCGDTGTRFVPPCLSGTPNIKQGCR